MSSTDQRIKDFIDESRENLDEIDSDLVALEKDPGSSELISKVFRVVHTVKGTCGFFGFSRLEAVTHAAEEILSRLREGQIALDPEILSALLFTVDAVRRMLVAIEKSRTDGEEDYKDFIEHLVHLGRGSGRVGNDPPTEALNAEVVSAGSNRSNPAHVAQPPAVDLAQSQSDNSIRVDVALLGKLMNLVGELVLTRNQMVQLTQSQRDRSLLSASQRLSLITTRLQGEVMKTRLQRIETLWDRLPRTVRDIAVACGKRVRLEMEGQGTELDKSIIETIKDPLIHLVRNSIAHGIESPSARAIARKPPEGCIHLRAFHENGHVRIEVRDDGAGIDIERVRRKALANACVTPERAVHLTQREAIELIFRPGFSTAETVTSVSGRGVGLDVVKTNIERIGGAVEVESAPGQGTTFSLKIPLTLAIIPALIVTSLGERFAIPQIHLLELVRLNPTATPGLVEMIHDAAVFRLRGKLLPIVDLRKELRLYDMAGKPESSAQESPAGYLLVLQTEGRQFGLVVDKIHDTEEIVVKPMGKRLQPLAVFAGATVMGDGRASLILDVPNIAQRAGLDQGPLGRGPGEQDTLPAAQTTVREKLLLARGPGNTLYAMPLRFVERLEDVPLSSLERLGGKHVLQYRGEILPLVYLDELVGARGAPFVESPTGAEATPGGALHVVVCRNGSVIAGLVVDGIVDIVNETLSIKPLGGRPGVLGSMVIDGRVTEFVDLDEVSRLAGPAVFGSFNRERVAEVSHA